MVELVQQNLDAIRSLCARHGVRRMFLIGSATGSGFGEHRDVDFLVDFVPSERRGFDDAYFELREELSSLLTRPIDLIEASSLRNPYRIASINRTKQVLYAA